MNNLIYKTLTLKYLIDKKNKFYFYIYLTKNKATMKITYTLLLLSITGALHAQITLIPDSQFETKLVNMGIDTDGIVNGQILTADAQNLTNLNLGMGVQGGITNFSGIETFTNLESLETFYNCFVNINLVSLTKLKILNLSSNTIYGINLSNNVNLEHLTIGNKVLEFMSYNIIYDLDLSNNTKLKYVDTFNLFTLNSINLRNHQADSLFISVGNEDLTKYPQNVCIEVDDYVAATNKQAPYDNWTVVGTHYFSDKCTLNIEKFVLDNFKIYPNPTSDYVVIDQKDTENVQLQSVQIIDNSGKWIRTIKENFNYINVSNLKAGTYLFVIQTNKGNKTEKIIIN